MSFRVRLQPKLGKRERLTVGATATPLTAAKYTVDYGGVEGQTTKADGALIQVIGSESIIWTMDGSDPSVSAGFEVSGGDTVTLESAQQVKNFKAIRSGANDAAIEVCYLFGN